MKKFWGKYRSDSQRLEGWNYAAEGMYFITFNTADRICCFGVIENKKMIYNPFGQIAHDEWMRSFEIREELFLDEFVIMPNHIHGIVVIKNSDPADPAVETDGRRSVHGRQPQPKSISTFLSGFKSAVVTGIDNYIDVQHLAVPKYNKANPLWQRDYHDHIIRDEREHRRIKQYIINNPATWDRSDYYPFGYDFM